MTLTLDVLNARSGQVVEAVVAKRAHLRHVEPLYQVAVDSQAWTKSPTRRPHPLPSRPRKHIESRSVVRFLLPHHHPSRAKLTSRVLECNIRIFFAVIICTNIPVSICLISMKLGSKASMYGVKMANAFGVPSHVIIQSGLARQPFLLTKNE